MNAFPAIVLPMHRSLTGYRVVAHGRGASITAAPGEVRALEQHREFFSNALTYAHSHNDVYLLVRGDEAMAWNQQRPPIDITDAGAQTVLREAERKSLSDVARRRAAEPLRPLRQQAACDIGLFGDAHKQADMFPTQGSAKSDGLL